MRKLKVNDKMSAAICVGCVGGLLSSEKALNDNANPKIRSERLSIRGLGFRRVLLLPNRELLSDF